MIARALVVLFLLYVMMGTADFYWEMSEKCERRGQSYHLVKGQCQ